MVSKQISILQANLQNSRSAFAELLNFLLKEQIDVACLQEPYNYSKSNNRSLLRVPKPYAVLHTWSDVQLYSAIIYNTSLIDATFLTEESNNYITAARLSTRSDSYTVASVYCPPSLDIDPILQGLQDLIEKTEGDRLIIAGDFNAKSPAWFSQETDVRGESVEDFLISNDLFTINEPLGPTFVSLNGESHIDLTIANAASLEHTFNWKLIADVVESDHRMILFTLGALDRDETYKIKYNTRKYKIEDIRRDAVLTARLLDGLGPWRPDKGYVDNWVEQLTEEVKAIQESNLKKIRHFRRNSWWSAELDELKSQVKNRRQTLQRVRRAGLPDIRAKDDYKGTLKMYKKAILRRKAQSWHNFVKNDLSRNPWGLSYRLASRKIIDRPILSAISNESGLPTHEEAMKRIATSLIPSDDPNQDTEERANTRACIDDYVGLEAEIHFSEETILEAAGKICPGKAPGIDEITGTIVKLVIPDLVTQVCELFNTCLTLGYFPDKWKEGRLVTILKSPDKDPAEVSSLRPITLLCEFGKLFERTILDSLLNTIPEPQLLSCNQYGFRKGMSTISALSNLMEFVTLSEPRQTMVIFVDIKGAFDNLWWPALFKTLHEKQIPTKIVTLIKSYLAGRRVIYRTNFQETVLQITRGCPQGSVLGPFLWNMGMDTLLRLDWPDEVKIIAYADDVAVCIKGDTRQALERLSRECMEMLSGWMDANNLRLSAHKTSYMIFNSKLCFSRNPVVRYKGEPIKRIKSNKYLGVILDVNLNFYEHIRYITGKAKRIFHVLRRYTRKNWGQVFHSLAIIYLRAVIPIISYAAQIWGKKAQAARSIRMLGSAQGVALRAIMNAYKTTPTDTLCVLGRSVPLDLMLSYLYFENEFLTVGAATLCGRDFAVADYRSWAEVARAAEEHLLGIWQNRWNISIKGRQAYEFFPSITEWLNAPTVMITENTVHMLTSHGDFGIHLKRIGKSEEGLCQLCEPPGELDSPIHRIYDCRGYITPRRSLEEVLPNWPIPPSRLVISLGQEINVLEEFTSSELVL